MMETKGGSIKDTPNYVKDTFGDEGYAKWLNSLSPESKKIYSSTILPSVWYSFKDASIDPMRKITELFYRGDPKGSITHGKYSAEKTLSGLYRFFLKFGSPSYIISKAGTITTTFTKPSKCEVAEKGSNHFVIRFTQFPDMIPEIEYYIQGFMEKALELCGCTNIAVKMNKCLTKGDEYTEYEGHWE